MKQIEMPNNLTELQSSLETLGLDALSAGRQVWLAGLGLAVTVGETVTETFDSLVAKGRRSGLAPVEEAEKALASARRRASRLETKVEKAVESRLGALLGRLGVPTRSEVQELTRRVENLAQSLR
jgi:poly(hydroxyalkanoate) granule-associated protein